MYQELKSRFDSRISFDPTERLLYSHDIASIPSLFAPLIGNTVPDCVVQPETEEDLVMLVNFARERGIPLTPRGKATSGYGGVVPLKHGIVVDFYRMSHALRINEASLTAVVQPGIVWEKLDAMLMKSGYTLRLYPTSYPSSTVGGWLAMGGAGIGSYESGWFRDNVIRARVVLPDGSVREFSGPDLETIADAEGTTGMISQVEIRIQKYTHLKPMLVQLPDAAAAALFVQSVRARRLAVWSLSVLDPVMVRLRNEAPLKTHNGHPSEKRVVLPEGFLAVVAFREEETLIREGIVASAGAARGTVLDEALAEHEWENRFRIMMIKRLGPSVVPAEVVVPLGAFSAVMTEIRRRIHQPLAIEGMIVGGRGSGEPEVVLLGLLPSDERKFKFNFQYGAALSVIRIAERHGGRGYAAGMFFTKRADSILGRERAHRIRQAQKIWDPKRIMNPGKVTRGFAGTAISVAARFEPLIRFMGNRFPARVGERIGDKPVRGIPADVHWYSYSCSGCGYCIDECDQFYGRGWESQNPRGKWWWLREYTKGNVELDQKMADTFLVCTTCELCNLRCSASLPIEPSWMKLRGRLIKEEKKMTFPPFEIMASALKAQGDIWAGYRKDRASWFPADLLAKHGPAHKAKAVYFAGCTASYVEHDIGMAAVRIMDEAGVDFTYLGEKENCCATPMLVAGKWELFADTMKKNIAAVQEAGADTVISSCPACDMMWRTVYPEWAKKLGFEYHIKARHYSEVLTDKMKEGSFAFPNGKGDGGNGAKERVTWHDSCHIGRASGVYDPPRDVIKALPGVELVEMEHHREHAHCCGSVLTLIKEPDVAARIGKSRIDEAAAVDAKKLLALCPCCQFQLRVSAEKAGSNVEVVDLARYAAEKLGYTFPDPNPEVMKQWAVFEKMIALMTPAGFADLMGTMWPELIAAMPLGMGPMMRAAGKVPGMLQVMKPMFPVLFPMLLPGMMKKLLPTMLDRIKGIVPMPDYMAEQMPELMPEVMGNLMPHMLPDVVPLVTDPMIAYLRGKRPAVTA